MPVKVLKNVIFPPSSQLCITLCHKIPLKYRGGSNSNVKKFSEFLYETE